MGRRYKRKTDRGSWTEENMNRAIAAIKDKKMGWQKAADTYNIPQATLRRKFKISQKNNFDVALNSSLGRFRPVFNEEVEKSIVTYALDLESRLFGVTTIQIRKTAFLLAEKMKIPHTFSMEKRMAGEDWLKGFRDRNPQISLRIPEPTSAARALAFNRPQVEKFFKTLRDIIDKEKIFPANIYNMDEKPLSTVHKSSRVLASKGKKQVGSISSGERGPHVTAAACVNATGQDIPPTLIFPRKTFNQDLYDGAPLNTLKLFSEKGYMTTELFDEWMNHFVKFSHASANNKVLLLLDGHSSHKSFHANTLAKENHVTVLCFPPHCTHRLQPLDVGLYGPLQQYYDKTVEEEMKKRNGKPISLYQVSRCFRNAYELAFTKKNAASAYKATGIVPFNENIFPDDLFLPAETTNTPMVCDDSPASVNQTSSQSESDSPPTVVAQMSSNVTLTETDSPATVVAQTSLNQTETNSLKTTVLQTLNQILPLPSRPRSANKSNSNVSKGAHVLTSSPEILAQKLLAEKKKQKEEKQAIKKRENKKSKRKIVFENDNELQTKKSRPKRQSAALKKTTHSYQEENDGLDIENLVGESDSDEEACIYCNGLYKWSKKKEKWNQCAACSKWAHTLCAGISYYDDLICDLCT